VNWSIAILCAAAVFNVLTLYIAIQILRENRRLNTANDRLIKINTSLHEAYKQLLAVLRKPL
jgi:hypothetical protein